VRNADASAAIELQFREILGRLQPRIEKIATHIESLGQGGLPRRHLQIDQLAQRLAAAGAFAAVMNLESLAIVGENGEEIGPRARALAQP
jgi:hypothetical protein